MQTAGDRTELPSGTITFCFTDIEGSTRLFQRLGAEYLTLLDAHRSIVRAALARHGGFEVKTEGDGFFLAFRDGSSAVAALLEIQRGHAARPWPDGAHLRVRAGLHCGWARPVDDDYLTLDVHVAARVAGAGHGGQVLLSPGVVAASLSLPKEAALLDLGEHGLKDLPEPLRLYQLCHPDIPREFPAIRSVGTSGAANNLPAAVSSFVGRAGDKDTVSRLVEDHRMVTITGAGGAGKTRLALEVAQEAVRRGHWRDGVFLVDLAAVTDDTAVATVALASVGVHPDPSTDPTAQLAGYLAERHTLLVIDNCEHLVAATGSLLTTLLSRAPSVTLIATSREPLGIAGETAWRIPPLPASDAIQLFVTRAGRVAGAELASADDPAIDHICTRLDGIPLAIELAAARTNVLSPTQIAERLDDRFRLLTGGARTAIARQQTLQATVDWSYALLDDDERAVLRRLSVFSGGFTLTAAESVCAFGAIDDVAVLDLLARLVDKSLVVAELAGDRLRYRLLETIRQYARHKLLDADEVVECRTRHASAYSELIDTVGEGLRDNREVQARLELLPEHDNLRAAVEWAIETGDAATAVRIVGGAWMFWAIVGTHVAEGFELVTRALASVDGDVEPIALAKAHTGAAHLAWIGQRPSDEVERHADAALALLSGTGQPTWYGAWVLLLRLGARTHDHSDAHRAEVERAVDTARRAADPFVLGHALVWLGNAAPDDDASEAAFTEAIDVLRDGGSRSSLSQALTALSRFRSMRNRRDAAVALAEDAVGAARLGANTYFEIFSLQELSLVKARRGDVDAAVPLRQALATAETAGIEVQIARCNYELAYFDLVQRQHDVARRRLDVAYEIFNRHAQGRTIMQVAAAGTQVARAEIDLLDGRIAEARSVIAAIRELAVALNVEWAIDMLAVELGWCDLFAGELDAAASTFVAAARATQDSSVAAAGLRGLAVVAARVGDDDRAARLSGAALTVPEPHQRAPRIGGLVHADTVRELRDRMGGGYDDVAAGGAALNLEAAIAEATHHLAE